METKESKRERMRIYRQKNREKILEQRRESDKKYYEKKRQEIIEKRREYHAANREKVAEQKRRRREKAAAVAAEIGVPVSHILFDAEKISAQKKEYRNRNLEAICDRNRKWYLKKKAEEKRFKP
jgi:hypothetical protein